MGSLLGSAEMNHMSMTNWNELVVFCAVSWQLLPQRIHQGHRQPVDQLVMHCLKFLSWFHVTCFGYGN